MFICLWSDCQDGDMLSPAHVALLNQCITKVRDNIGKLSFEHKELHGGVSKVGKAIDKVSASSDIVLLSDRLMQ